MIGLPGQDASSVMETIDYCAYLIDKFPDKRLSLFIGPLAPFLDPGSIALKTLKNMGTSYLPTPWKNTARPYWGQAGSLP